MAPPELWFWVIGWILTTLVVAGNGIVIYYITTKRKLRTTTNVFVASLAAADFALGATYLPLLVAACAIDSSCIANSLIRHSLVNLLICSSMFNLCALTMDRYLAIVKPLRYIKFTNGKRVGLLPCAAWAISVLFFLAPFLAVELLPSTDEDYEFYYKCFSAYFSVVQLGVCVAWVLATLRILRIARETKRRNAALMAQLKFNHPSDRPQSRSRPCKEAASANIICILVVVFMIYNCVDILNRMCYILSYDLGFVVLDLVSLLMLANSASNPVAYAFFKKDIKNELRLLLSCMRQRKISNAIDSVNNTFNTVTEL